MLLHNQWIHFLLHNTMLSSSYSQLLQWIYRYNPNNGSISYCKTWSCHLQRHNYCNGSILTIIIMDPSLQSLQYMLMHNQWIHLLLHDAPSSLSWIKFGIGQTQKRTSLILPDDTRPQLDLLFTVFEIARRMAAVVQESVPASTERKIRQNRENLHHLLYRNAIFEFTFDYSFPWHQHQPR